MSGSEPHQTLKIGTRRSSLALAQSRWVAQALERAFPEIKTELVGIKTQGDRNQNIPLHQMEGQSFFVAELDRALLEGEVDCNVHSYKDLSLERPQGLALASIPNRINPRDIVLFHSDIEEDLKKDEALKLGSSSPRRIENTPAFLKKALPNKKAAKTAPSIQCVQIRGNIQTRIKRLFEPKDSKRFCHGVVLAAAGLIRAWEDPQTHEEIKKLLAHTYWMLLPVTHCPGAAAQGALAVECREEDRQTRELLKSLHDPKLQEQIERERIVLKKGGGGCHQRFGVASQRSPYLGPVTHIHGKTMKGENWHELLWDEPSVPDFDPERIWDGGFWRREMAFQDSQADSAVKRSEAKDWAHQWVFVAHHRALPENEDLSQAHLWTAGSESWFQLAEKGYWIEGCSEGLGFSMLEPPPFLGWDHRQNLSSGARGSSANPADISQWVILTHDQAKKDWTHAKEALATYSVKKSIDWQKSKTQEGIARLQEAREIFWSSASQWEQLGAYASPSARHYCRAGKSYAFLKEKGISPLYPFPSRQVWLEWANR